MKTKCRTLNLSITISLFSFILYSLFFILNNYNHNIFYEYIYNMILGLFGSSFVVFLISIAEYRVSKTQLLEKIWNESRKLNAQLYKIKPIHSYIDNEILVGYINEWLINQNDNYKSLYKNKSKSYTKIYNYLLEYHREELKNMSKKDIKLYINSLIDNERKKIFEELEKVMDQYLNLNNYSFLELNNLLGDVQFFTRKKQYIKLYNDIYNPLRNMYNELKENVCYHINLYKNGEANRLDVLLSIIFENQDKLFRIEKRNEKDCEWNIIYADFCDNMDDKIEDFRAKTIYRCEKETINYYPIESFFHNKK